MIRHDNCTVTITSVFVSGRHLYRLRVWDNTKQQIVALRMWADTPYKKGSLVRLQPEDMPQSEVRDRRSPAER